MRRQVPERSGRIKRQYQPDIGTASRGLKVEWNGWSDEAPSWNQHLYIGIIRKSQRCHKAGSDDGQRHGWRQHGDQLLNGGAGIHTDTLAG